MCLQTLLKIQNIKFHGNALQGLCSCYLRVDGQTDMAKLRSACLKPETINCPAADIDADCSFLFVVSHRRIPFSDLRS